MNQVPSPQCPHCGRNLSTDDLRGQNCPSCGTALPHHARAAQQVALVNQVMAQHMGAAANPYANPYGNPYANPHANPYANPHAPPLANPHYVHAMNQAGAATNKAFKTLFLVIGIFVAVSILLSVGITIVAVVLSH